MLANAPTSTRLPDLNIAHCNTSPPGLTRPPQIDSGYRGIPIYPPFAACTMHGALTLRAVGVIQYNADNIYCQTYHGTHGFLVRFGRFRQWCNRTRANNIMPRHHEMRLIICNIVLFYAIRGGGIQNFDVLGWLGITRLPNTIGALPSAVSICRFGKRWSITAFAI